MQFMLLGYDGEDDGALGRRLKVREQHLALGDKLFANGNLLYGGAMLDDHGRMMGSMLVLDFPSRTELDAWLAVEPYMLHGVWVRTEVAPFRVGPLFVGASA